MKALRSLVSAVDDFLVMVRGECGAPFENVDAERLDSALMRAREVLAAETAERTALREAFKAGFLAVHSHSGAPLYARTWTYDGMAAADLEPEAWEQWPGKDASPSPAPEGSPDPEWLQRLTVLFDTAFGADHPAMLDFAEMLFERKRLLRSVSPSSAETAAPTFQQKEARAMADRLLALRHSSDTDVSDACRDAAEILYDFPAVPVSASPALREQIEALITKAVSTRAIVRDHIGGEWDPSVSHGPRKLGHNPSWVKASDLMALLSAAPAQGTTKEQP